MGNLFIGIAFVLGAASLIMLYGLNYKKKDCNKCKTKAR